MLKKYSVNISSGIARADYVKGSRASHGWHTDITFERVPADYTVSVSVFAEYNPPDLYLVIEDAYNSRR